MDYKGFFLYNDRSTLGTIEDVAEFIADLLDEQKKGNLPYDLCFFWDSIGSIPCKMSVEANKNNPMWNAGAMSQQFGNFINQRFPLSRKESSSFTNSMVAINKIWIAPAENIFSQPKMKMKNGETMFLDASIVLTFGNINLKDTKTSKEYMIVQESEMDEFNEMDEFGMDEEFEMDDEFNEMDEFGMDEEFEMDDEFNEMDDLSPDDVFEFDELDEEDEDGLESKVDDVFNEVFEQYSDEEEENEGVMYELELDDEGLEEDEISDLYESKSFKPKGKGFGTANKFKYSSKPNQEGGFNTKKKEGPKSVGTGKAKFTYKDGENLDGEFKIKPKKKVEANEASRTYANGSKSGRGLRKGITPNRNLNLESVDGELNLLREKNNEYRNALNVFRDKLNEVAVFNSNLAYATRLFTEHTTTKQEKINILKRFDSVETIKESKNLYQSIKQELNKDNSSKPINESIERSIDNSPSTGSAINLIESKTYENPQFLRMRDLMSKIK